MQSSEVRYTVASHVSIFNGFITYSIQDNKRNVDIELDHKCDVGYAVEVCRKFNREDKQGLHDQLKVAFALCEKGK